MDGVVYKYSLADDAKMFDCLIVCGLDSKVVRGTMVSFC